MKIRNYKVDVDYDKETMRVKQCVRCGNTDFSESALYCKVCGLPLSNFCLGDDDNDIPPHINPPDARYCEHCGCETEYFGTYHALRSYYEIMQEEDGDNDDTPF